jgi:uncharacterized repeat protein (TIGR01451 family)
MRTDRPGFLRGLASVIALLVLTACGGGGGDGGGGAGGGTSPVYTGNPSAAVITTANASTLAAGVAGSGDITEIIGAVSVQGDDSARKRLTASTDPARHLSRVFRDTLRRATSDRRVVSGLIPIEQTDPCPGGGTVRTSGTLNDNGTGALQISFSNCVVDGIALNGPATLRVDEAQVTFSVVPTDATLIFTRLTLRGVGVSVDVGGSLRTRLGNGNNTETIWTDMVSENNIAATTSKESLVYVNVYDNMFSPTSVTASISGRLFDHIHGYVDIATVTPLFFASLSQQFPGNGQLVLTGDGNRRIRATALSGTHTRLDLDLDGNGAYEGAATLQWTELAGPVGSDLADSDGDGMHNSWEVAKGLDPNNSTDAASDNDGDGFSILQEYLAGTDPNDAGSKPPTVGLSIALSDAPDPATVGGNLTYTITVSNSTVTAASNVVVMDMLPADVTLVSATPSQGSCSGASPVTCSLGTLNGFASAFVTIVVTPTASGELENAANVTTSAIDLDMSDNSAMTTTTVWQAVAATIVALPSNSDLVFDAVSQKIYASVLGNPGSVVPIDPVAGTAGTAIAVGSDPVRLARSDNGQYLYLGLDGDSSVQRIDLATQAVDLTFSLGSDSFFGPIYAGDIEVLPGSPQSVAVSKRYKSVSPSFAGVGIYDDGVMRPTAVAHFSGTGHSINVIEFAASASTLFGYDNATTRFGFYRMAVDGTGVSILDVYDSFMNGGLITGFGVDMEFHGGLIYTTTGKVIDPVARTVVGTFSLPSTFDNLVVADASVGRAFFLNNDGFSGAWNIRVFDLTTRQPLGGAILQGVTGTPGSFIRWGAKGLAFRTSTGQIHLIQSPALIP